MLPSGTAGTTCNSTYPPQFYLRLFETLQNPAELEEIRETDRQLMRTGIPTDQREQEEWGWDPLLKIYHFCARDIPYHRHPKSAEEWANQYAEHCWETISRIVTPSVHIEQEVGIALPAPLSNLEHPQLIKRRYKLYWRARLLREH